ncbi:MAG: type III pantothenate kinase, partial [Candidatus Omnitrophica bacterium]|nr:type III pantothenate kinase [Candidatus Omnitrophota bacterium]
MKNVFAIDIGNTNIAFGIFRGGILIRKAKIPTSDYSKYNAHAKRLLKTYPIDKIIVSSVVPAALARLKKALQGAADSKILILGANIRAPIRNLYKAKEEVGQDRLVNAFAGSTLYGAPCVIIDFGTAITFDVVSKKGAYLGGLILPGIAISLSSLYEKTALLPKVRLAPSRKLIGKDTVASMRGCILFGFGAMCDGLVAKYRKILGKSLK